MGSLTWSCGIRRLPVETDEGPVTGVLWVDDRGVVGIEVASGTEVEDAAILAGYRQATTDPNGDRTPARPKKVRVADPALAKRLRPLLRGVAIEIRPTPEIDVVLEAMEDAFEGTTGDDLARFIELPEAWRDDAIGMAEALMDTLPWESLPPEPALELRIPSLGISDGRLAVMGHNGEILGLVAFFTPAELQAFSAAASADVPPVLPRCIGVDVVELPAAPPAPSYDAAIVSVVDGVDRRAPEREEMLIAGAATYALARFVVEEEERLGSRHAWEAGIERRIEVGVLGVKIDVELRAVLPHTRRAPPRRPARPRGEKEATPRRRRRGP